MRHQRLALLIAAGTLLLALGVAVTTIAIANRGSTEHRDRIAADAIAGLDAALGERGYALSASAEAMLKDQGIRSWALGQRAPAWYSGIPREAVRAPGLGGVDYLLVIGPGGVVVGEQGNIAGPTFAPDTMQRPLSRALLLEQHTGGIARFPDGPLLFSSARTGAGTDALAVVLGVRLDEDEIDRLGRAQSRALALTYDGAAAGQTPHLETDGGTRRAVGLIQRTVDGETLVARVGVGVFSDQETNAQALLTVIGLLTTAGGLAALVLVLRGLVDRIQSLGEAIVSGEPEAGLLPALQAMRGPDEIGQIATATSDAFVRLRGRIEGALEEARMATARQLLGEHVIRSMTEGVLVERSDAVTTVVNPASVELLGVTLADLAGERGLLERTLGTPLYNALRLRAHQRPDTPPMLVTWSSRELVFDAYEVVDVSGESVNLMIIVRDVSGVLESERLKRDLVSMASHELRTPLTVLSMAVDLFAEDARPEQQAIVASAQRGAQRMRDLVEDLLDLARLENETATLDIADGDLADDCAGIAAMLHPVAAAKQVGISLHGPEGSLIVQYDRRHLERALTNLVGNAVKFTPEGGHVWIEYGVEEHPDGPYAFVNVLDNGPGVPPEEQTRIFHRFYRASNTRGVIPGTGLGLSLAAQIMALHGGTATLTHSDASGSRFRLEWPAVHREGVPSEA